MGVIQTMTNSKVPVPVSIEQAEQTIVRNGKQRFSDAVCKADLLRSIHVEILPKLKQPPLLGGVGAGWFSVVPEPAAISHCNLFPSGEG